MKKTLFATACAVATLLAAPAFAQDVSGFIGVSAAHTELDTPLGDSEGDAYGLSGSIAAPISGTFQVQFDGSVVDSEDADAIVTGTLHLSHRTDAFLVGGFVGGTEVADEGVIAGGVEAEAYLDQFTLGGAVTYVSADDLDVDGWAANANGRYFVGDNFRLDASLGFLSLDAMGVDVDGWTAGLGGEYQFTGAPVSLFAGVSRVDVNDVDITADTVSVGVRWNFGGSLKDRDRKGASLGGIERIAGGLIF